MIHKLLGLHVPMPSRDHKEAHRSATTLELFYDLVIVIAIAFAAQNLHHSIVENHILSGIVSFLMIFWSIFWAWMSFTWFSSSYDTDDISYRIAVFVQLVGSLIIAAGVNRAFSHSDFSLITIGYVIMRLALVSLWIRVIKSNPQDKIGAWRFVIGISVCQIGWILLAFIVPESLMLAGFFVLVICESIVPIIMEQAKSSKWHRNHIIERYGLVTIIVLGESLLSSAIAIQKLFEHYNLLLLSMVAGSLLSLFCMWWLYFDEKEHPRLRYTYQAFLWGYGHFIIFASITAIGAGLAIVTDQLTAHSDVSYIVANASVAIPAAVFILSMWLIHDLHGKRHVIINVLMPAVSVLILFTVFSANATLLIGIVLMLTLIARRKLLA